MTALAHDPLEGTGKYRAIKELGRGGMGEVFLGEHVALGTPVVVKLLHAELSSKNTLVDRMRIEAQACARLNHPNIVRVTDFDRTPSGRPYFVMEYLPGKALSDVVKDQGGSLPVAEAIDVVMQALEGLSAAHANGLVHRDIKLDNLFVCDPTTPGGKSLLKILDFGVAKVLDSAGADAPAQLAVPTGTGVVVGTPRFFAPEQARGKALDHRADIYAMGLVLYTLLAGRGPFDEARNITEMAKAHVFKAPEPPSHFAKQPVPDKLDAIVLRAIAKKPEQRFQSVTEMSAMLSRVAEGLSAAPAPQPTQTGVGGLAHTAYMPPSNEVAAAQAAARHAAGADPREPAHASPSAGAQPHSGQPHGGYPHSGQPHSGQPHSGQPHSGQQHSGQQHSGQPHAGHGAQPGGYPAAPMPAASAAAAPSPELPDTAPLPGSTQLGAAPVVTPPPLAPSPPAAVGAKRYSVGLAAGIVLLALMLGGAAAAVVLRFV